MSLIDKYNNEKPASAKANTRGVDLTPIGDGGKGYPEFSPSSDFIKDEKALTKARLGALGSMPNEGFTAPGYNPGNTYSNNVKKD